jgi:cytochrome c553
MYRLIAFSLLLAACKQDWSQSGGPDAGASVGLPCDVEAVLAAHCQSCHGNPPSGGAPISLVTYDDLMRIDGNGARYIDRAIVRMQDASKPMPPLPAVAASTTEIQTLQAWVAAGTPMGNCGATGGDPLNAAPTCTSGQTSTARESSIMDPGQACISCHANDIEAPKFTIAGTVYPTGHEPDNCYGISSVSVGITDANGMTITLTANAAGNFYSMAAVAFPIQAKVIEGGKERVMVGAQASGDCNSCHTQSGANMAPGRITVPF